MKLGYLSSANQWAAIMAGLLFMLVVGYIIWHKVDVPGSKNVMLMTNELEDIQNILDNTHVSDTTTFTSRPAAHPALNSDSAQAASTTDSAKQNQKTFRPARKSALRLDTNRITYQEKRRRVYEYIVNTHTMYDDDYKTLLQKTFNLLPDERSLRSYLSSHPIRVYSPYHLTSRSLLWELIFWAWFGVFCNLFYRVSESYKGTEVEKTGTETTLKEATGQPIHSETTTLAERLQQRMLGGFDPAEVPSQLAKLIYTPFLVVVIYLAASSFGSTTDLQWVQLGEGVIVFAFLLGFFSGRAVDLLERLKDLIFPAGRFGSQPLPPSFRPSSDEDQIAGDKVTGKNQSGTGSASSNT